jgi:Domain of unknown function (DUF4388)
MSHARKAALHLLNNEWSRGVWKHWLSNIFLPPVDPPLPQSAPPPPPTTTTASAATIAPTIASATVSRASPTTELSRERANTAPAPRTSPPARPTPSESPEGEATRDVRRSELRARFDALSDRLMAVEDGLDTLVRRSAQRDKQERRSGQQSAEVIDNVADAAERQASVLEGLLGTVARLEHAISRLEGGLSRVERALGDQASSRRDSHYPSSATQPPPRHLAPSQYPESHAAPRSPRSSDADDIDSNESASINGFLSEVSLSTILAMLEIERHSGRLKVATEDGMLASFELSEGSVVSSRLSENDADPLQTLRTALCWKQGRFWFRQQAAEARSFPPRSIGSLLLEATRQNDESFANVG